MKAFIKLNNAGFVTTCWDSTLTLDADRTDSGRITDGVVRCFDNARTVAVNAGCYVNKKKQLFFSSFVMIYILMFN